MFFGGINLLGISFIGEYISKIFEETKKRPKFIRRKVRKGIKQYNTSEEIRALVEQQRK
jgi:polyisoprenyl-phosphate glycosyltransferase